MKHGPQAHYVGRNHVSTLPRRFVYLDTEARQSEGAGKRVQTFRLGVAAFQTRRPDNDSWSECRYQTFRDQRGMWEAITDCARAKARTVVVAHNLAYDLRVSGALESLPALGWECRAIKLDQGHAWASWMNGTKSIVMVDSMSWVPLSLGDLAPLVGMAKCDLPAWNDSFEAWEQRCTTDVEILAEVWRRLMTWVEANDLGMWRTTGAGQAWSAFRHRFMEHDLLVHDDEEAREYERLASYTGRCEAWRHGSQRTGPFAEWDFTTAYAAVGRNHEVPVRLLRRHGAMDLDRYRDISCTHSILARVSVWQPLPTLPTLLSNGIGWPTGRFDSTLWDVEIDLALRNGATVEIHEAWVYEKAPALKRFCTWVLDLIEPANVEVEPVVKLMLKHWSRAIVGRFGARWSRWAEAGTTDVADVRRWQDLDGDTGVKTEMLQLGNRIMATTEVLDAPDCMPQVMSFVMAACRVKLWEAATAAGRDHVLYLDTDSIITDARGTAALMANPVPGLRIKHEYRSLEILGPRQLVLDGAVRAAGLPRSARKVGRRSFVADVWRGLDVSLRHGESTSVVITERHQELRATDRRRIHHPDGSTSPIAL